MSKEEFLAELKQKLQGLPEDDLNSRLSFYEEAIEDRMIDGKTEEEAVKDVGPVDYVVESIAKDTPFLTLVKQRTKDKKKYDFTKLILIILTSILWLPLLISLIVVLFSLYMVSWVLVLIPGITCIGSFGYSVLSFLAIFGGLADKAPILGYVGTFFAGAGLGLILIPATIYAVKGYAKLNALIAIKIKTKLIKKEK